MEDRLLARERCLKRCYECNRLEEELWNQVYEQLWPLVRRRLHCLDNAQRQPSNASSEPLAKGA